MDDAATARFEELMEGPEDSIRLDEAAALIAAHGNPATDEATIFAALDDLANRCRPPTLDGLIRLLFVDEGFHGNTVDYYDPRNSFLDEVLERRVGIPITLAVVTMEVGRRAGVPLAGIGMPGHFLLRDRVDPTVFVDPFEQGRLLDEHGCRERFRMIQPNAHFEESFLEPVGTREIVARMLGNLKNIYYERNDARSLTWVVRLRSRIPGVPPDERRQLAALLSAQGRYREAADEFEALDMQQEAIDQLSRLN